MPRSALDVASADETRGRTLDVLALLRHTFELESVPESVPARSSADGRYQLWVNGTRVAWGPVRGEPAHLRWDECDLASYLREGPNVVAAHIRHYGAAVMYWMPAQRVGDLGRGGFLLEALIGDRPLVTDGSWRCRVAPYERSATRPFGPPPAEIVDGRQFPWGWTEPAFDDSSWEACAELEPKGVGIVAPEPPTDPFGLIERNELPPLTEEVVRPVGVVGSGACASAEDPDPVRSFRADPPGGPPQTQDAALPGGEWRTFDFGRIVNAHPLLTLAAEPGTIVDLACGEDLDRTSHPVIKPREWTMRYTAAGLDDERVEAFEPVGFRYLQAAVRTGYVKSFDLAARSRRYPRPEGAFFACSDEALGGIWHTGAATLDACSTDAFLDCPGREQRAWLGDAYVETMVSLACNPDTGLARWNAILHGSGARSDGLLPMVAGGDFTDVPTTIPDYSLHWVRTVARLWEHLADGELVERLMPAVLRALDAFERQRGDDGLLTDVTGWVFVDWAQTERGRNTAALDALYALALDDAATLSDALGDHGTAGRLRARADQTRKSFEHYWDAERGVYVDAADAAGPRRRVSQQTNSLAILSGAPEDRWPAILGYVMDQRRLVFTKHPGDGAPERHRYQWMPPQEWGTGRPLDEETEVVLAQPFFCHFLHQALAAAGEHGALRSSIRRWQRLVDRGNGVFEEYWDHVPGEGSRCHAWSATPTYDLTAHVLGVRAAAPGWTDIAVRPCLGDLEWVEGGVPTPKGLVRLRLASDGSGFVELPPGVSGELLLADASLSLRSGRQEIRPA